MTTYVEYINKCWGKLTPRYQDAAKYGYKAATERLRLEKESTWTAEERRWFYEVHAEQYAVDAQKS